MHIVTKVLVVLAAILSVLLSGLSIAYTANADRLVAENRALQNKILGLESTHESALRQEIAEREQANQTIAAREGELSNMRAERDTIARELESLQSENSLLKLAESMYQAQIDKFTALMETYASLDEQQSAELGQLRTAQLESNRKEQELVDTINDLRSENEVQFETNRALQQQIAEIQRDKGRGGASGAETAGPVKAPDGFRARVTQIDTNQAGQTFVSIDAGTSDKLSKGMKLQISRGGKFIGTVTLDRVDVNEAVGLQLMLVGGEQFQAGDLVLPGV